MKIIEEDLVDWEPLIMRFTPSTTIAIERKSELCSFLQEWFQTNAAAECSDCDIRYWSVDIDQLSASCEHLTREALRRLTKALDGRFPEITIVRIGVALDGIPSGLGFEWVTLGERQVEMDGESHVVSAFAISTFQVSIGQFKEFIAATGYTPDCDNKEYPGYLETHLSLNWGKNPKTPVFGVSFNDACAFCDWAGVRLPTEIELHHFFVERAVSGFQPQWCGHCWTTTQTTTGNYVLRDGPYPATIGLPLNHFRCSHAADHHDYPFPSFRVARSLRGL